MGSCRAVTALPIQAVGQSISDLSDEQLEEAVQLQYQRELENLIDKAKNGAPDEKNQALVELSTKSENEAHKGEMDALLRQGLQNEDPDVRGQVLSGLASGGHDESRQIIENGLSDETPVVRATAVNAMSVGDEQWYGPLPPNGIDVPVW